MSLHVSSEVGLFQEFLVRRTTSGAVPNSLDDAVKQFRLYQEELDRLKNDLQVGIDQCNRGESTPLDAEAIKQEFRDRLASERSAES